MPLATTECINRGCGTLLTVEREGQVVGCLEYDWVKNYLDMLRADCGLTTLGGDVLYVSNIKVFRNDPTIIRELRRQLPSARYIVGLKSDFRLKVPKGVPHDFYLD